MYSLPQSYNQTSKCKRCISSNAYGQSPIDFLKQMKMKRALQLIENKEYNISEIAYMVGFNDAHYFSKCFKQTYGISPTEYKNNIDR